MTIIEYRGINFLIIKTGIKENKNPEIITLNPISFI
jgi:hypothetical protein